MQDRLERTQAQLRAQGCAGLFVGASSDLRWLLGYHALPLERLTLLVLPAEGPGHLVVPELEMPRAAASGAGELVDLQPWSETDDPFALVDRLVDAAGADRAGRWAVQDQLWTSFTLSLQASLPQASWERGSEVTGPLRIRKTPAEVAALRAVGAAIDEVHAAVPGLLRAGRTEMEVGRDIAERILVDHDEVNFVIVASGPNGASPHHETGNRVLEEGDAVVVDIGGTMDGYCSDETRNYAIGHAPDGYDQMHRVLEAAQAASVASVRPGVTAASIDAAARDVLEDAGYGQWFVHRTGHGIGVDAHEPPWIVGGNEQLVEPGMAFSIEPGVYVPDRHGARIEDIVVVTDDGVESLNLQPHELTVA